MWHAWGTVSFACMLVRTCMAAAVRQALSSVCWGCTFARILSLMRGQVPQPSVFSPPSKSLTIVIPAYNEEDRLGPTLDETIQWVVTYGNRQDTPFEQGIVWTVGEGLVLQPRGQLRVSAGGAAASSVHVLGCKLGAQGWPCGHRLATYCLMGFMQCLASCGLMKQAHRCGSSANSSGPTSWLVCRLCTPSAV